MLFNCSVLPSGHKTLTDSIISSLPTPKFKYVETEDWKPRESVNSCIWLLSEVLTKTLLSIPSGFWSLPLSLTFIKLFLELFLYICASWSTLLTISSRSPSLSRSAYVAPLEKFFWSNPQDSLTSVKVKSVLFLKVKLAIASDGICSV